MARVLYTSWFSTFARKAALGLELKGLAYEAVDALTREFRPEPQRVNPRVEVPVLLDDGLVVVNSSDILSIRLALSRLSSVRPPAIADRVAPGRWSVLPPRFVRSWSILALAGRIETTTRLRNCWLPDEGPRCGIRSP
jgi:hypothetical protein